MKRSLCAVIVTSIASIGAAHAQTSAPQSKPKPSVTLQATAPTVASRAFSWTGFYAGVNAGYNWSNRSSTPRFFELPDPDPQTADEIIDSDAVINGPGTIGVPRSGFIGGIQAGYNYQIGAMVLGAEIDFMGTNSSKTGTATGSGLDPADPDDPQDVAAAIVFNQSVKVSQNWLGTVRARAGVAYERAFFFATAGLAYGNAKVSAPATATVFTLATPIETATGNWSGSKSVTRAGFAVGAGVEYAVTDNWVLKFEYLYYNLGSASVTSSPSTMVENGVSAPNDALLASTTKVRLDGNIVRAGLSYKF